MAKKEVAPGVLCRVIGGNLGPKSPNINRVVKVLNRHTNPNPHTVWDVIWECVAADGKGGFAIARDKADVYGAGAPVMTIASFPDEWLEPLEEDTPPPQVRTREQELTD